MKNFYSMFQVVLVGCLLGCSASSENDATVQGTVTIDGVLATRGTVTFHPHKEGPVAVGQIHSDGSYALRTGLGNATKPDAAKIPAGKYVVTVMVMGDPVRVDTKEDGRPLNAGPRLTALKYASKETSGLEFIVAPKRNVYALELDSAATDPPPEPIDEEGESTDEGDKSEVEEGAEKVETVVQEPKNEQPALEQPRSDTEVDQ